MILVCAMKKLIVLLSLILMGVLLYARQGLEIYTELGAAFMQRASIRSPNWAGELHLFELEKEQKLSTSFSSRIALDYEFAKGHSISLMVAPLAFEGKGKLSKNLSFAGQNFALGQDVSSLYKQSEMMLLYGYRFKKPLLVLNSVGLGASHHNSQLRLISGSLTGKAKEAIFSPAMQIELGYPFLDELNLIWQTYLMYRPKYQAVNQYLGLDFEVNNELGFRLGYGFVLMEFDGAELYAQSMVHLCSLGFSMRF